MERDSDGGHRTTLTDLLGENELHLLAESASDGIVAIDAASTILYANAAIEDLFGYPVDELVGHSLTMLMPERLRGPHRTGIERYLRTGKRHLDWRSTELPGMHRHGHEIALEISFAAFSSDRRRIFAGFIRDVSLRKQLEAERAELYAEERAAREQAQRAIEARDQVLSFVTHDLRGLFSTVELSGEVLREGSGESESLERHLSTLRRTIRHGLEMIEDLVAVRTSPGEGPTLQRQAIAPTQLLADLHEELEPAATKAGVELVSQPAEGLPEMAVDGERIRRVLSNLVDNAVKFSPPGASVEVAAEAEHDRVHFRVSDSGPGIPPKHYERLFEPFWQGNRSEGRGAGLGLAIARHFIEAHAGRIWVESEVGRGSTFHFTLPVDGT